MLLEHLAIVREFREVFLQFREVSKKLVKLSRDSEKFPGTGGNSHEFMKGSENLRTFT